jgi:hypothetical protein
MLKIVNRSVGECAGGGEGTGSGLDHCRDDSNPNDLHKNNNLNNYNLNFIDQNGMWLSRILQNQPELYASIISFTNQLSIIRLGLYNSIIIPEDENQISTHNLNTKNQNFQNCNFVQNIDRFSSIEKIFFFEKMCKKITKNVFSVLYIQYITSTVLSYYTMPYIPSSYIDVIPTPFNYNSPNHNNHHFSEQNFQQNSSQKTFIFHISLFLTLRIKYLEKLISHRQNSKQLPTLESILSSYRSSWSILSHISSSSPNFLKKLNFISQILFQKMKKMFNFHLSTTFFSQIQNFQHSQTNPQKIPPNPPPPHPAPLLTPNPLLKSIYSSLPVVSKNYSHPVLVYEKPVYSLLDIINLSLHHLSHHTELLTSIGDITTDGDDTDLRNGGFDGVGTARGSFGGQHSGRNSNLNLTKPLFTFPDPNFSTQNLLSGLDDMITNSCAVIPKPPRLNPPPIFTSSHPIFTKNQLQQISKFEQHFCEQNFGPHFPRTNSPPKLPSITPTLASLTLLTLHQTAIDLMSELHIVLMHVMTTILHTEKVLIFFLSNEKSAKHGNFKKNQRIWHDLVNDSDDIIVTGEGLGDGDGGEKNVDQKVDQTIVEKKTEEMKEKEQFDQKDDESGHSRGNIPNMARLDRLLQLPQHVIAIAQRNAIDIALNELSVNSICEFFSSLILLKIEKNDEKNEENIALDDGDNTAEILVQIRQVVGLVITQAIDNLGLVRDDDMGVIKEKNLGNNFGQINHEQMLQINNTHFFFPFPNNLSEIHHLTPDDYISSHQTKEIKMLTNYFFSIFSKSLFLFFSQFLFNLISKQKNSSLPFTSIKESAPPLITILLPLLSQHISELIQWDEYYYELSDTNNTQNNEKMTQIFHPFFLNFFDKFLFFEKNNNFASNFDMSPIPLNSPQKRYLISVFSYPMQRSHQDSSFRPVTRLDSGYLAQNAFDKTQNFENSEKNENNAQNWAQSALKWLKASIWNGNPSKTDADIVGSYLGEYEGKIDETKLGKNSFDLLAQFYQYYLGLPEIQSTIMNNNNVTIAWEELYSASDNSNFEKITKLNKNDEKKVKHISTSHSPRLASSTRSAAHPYLQKQFEEQYKELNALKQYQIDLKQEKEKLQAEKREKNDEKNELFLENIYSSLNSMKSNLESQLKTSLQYIYSKFWSENDNDNEKNPKNSQENDDSRNLVKVTDSGLIQSNPIVQPRLASNRTGFNPDNQRGITSQYYARL